MGRLSAFLVSQSYISVQENALSQTLALLLSHCLFPLLLFVSLSLLKKTLHYMTSTSLQNLNKQLSVGSSDSVIFFLLFLLLMLLFFCQFLDGIHVFAESGTLFLNPDLSRKRNQTFSEYFWHEHNNTLETWLSLKRYIFNNTFSSTFISHRKTCLIELNSSF